MEFEVDHPIRTGGSLAKLDRSSQIRDRAARIAKNQIGVPATIASAFGGTTLVDSESAVLNS